MYNSVHASERAPDSRVSLGGEPIECKRTDDRLTKVCNLKVLRGPNQLLNSAGPNIWPTEPSLGTAPTPIATIAMIAPDHHQWRVSARTNSRRLTLASQFGPPPPFSRTGLRNCNRDCKYTQTQSPCALLLFSVSSQAQKTALGAHRDGARRHCRPYSGALS